MASSRSSPVETRSLLAAWFSPREVMGKTSTPPSSIRKGYSFVPWLDPRYLTTRRRRVATCSSTRWSRAITQSETYSSRPCRVSPLASFGRDKSRDALVLEPAEQAAELGPQDGLVGQAAEQRFQRVQHDPLGPDGVDGQPQPDEEGLQVVLAGLFNLAALDVDVVEGQLLLLHQLVEIEPE